MKIQHTLLVVAAVLAGAGLGWAADDELQAKYDAKIAKPFVSHGGWVVDYDDALARAKEEKKLIFAYFTRSYST